MVNLELLDLSGNNSIKVLPSLSGATNLKALVLDGCVGLEHVGPQGLPPSLESFCFDKGLGKDDENKAKITRISLAGCARLADFRLHGSLPNLEELDLSHTAVKMLDLKHEAAVQSLQKIFLQGCEQLHSISWPETWLQRYRKVGHQIRLLCIDTRAGREVSKKPSSCNALMVCQGDGEEYCRAFVATSDMRFLQSLEFLYETTKLKLNLYFSSTIKEDRTSCSTGRLVAGLPLPKSMPYHDVNANQQIMTLTDGSSGASVTMPFQPLEVHAEIAEGISDVPNTVSAQGRRAITFVMNRVESLRVHDSSSITNIGPAHVFMSRGVGNAMLSNQLETLHILFCGDLRQVFPVEDEFQEKIVASNEKPWAPWKSRKGMLAFPYLRHLYLHELPNLQLICEAKMFAPDLEAIYIRGCWSLRRLPATDAHRRHDGRPVAVDCEKEWWHNLEWDGMEHGHHPSLFQLRHSKYSKKRNLRGTVLR
nr:unnamed protein product [Digitaria exilis]